MKPAYLNLVVDHMTFLVEPRFYNVSYALFRLVLGVQREELIYEKRRKWPGDKEESSMTFASRIGVMNDAQELRNSIIAVVQPSEPKGTPSHVRDILKNRGGSAHWQHIALRTSDLLAFHKHARERGVNFITPILKEADEDLIQVFSGEWNMPGSKPTGIFFEFVQRDPSPALLKKIESSNRETFFRDKTFLGLYQEKQKEYDSGKIQPFIDDELFVTLEKLLGSKKLWDITDKDLAKAESEMKAYASARHSQTAKA
jgi:hypothetical protein